MTMRAFATAMVVALAVGLVACGGANRPASVATPEPPTPEEQAVLDGVQNVYPDQRITAAHCTKTGFDSAADIYTCTLTTADGETEPRQWRLFRDRTGKVMGPAMPADLQ